LDTRQHLLSGTLYTASHCRGEPGTQVLIAGANFGGTTQVKFNDSLSDFTVVSNDRILAVVPVESVSGPIAVVGLSGTAVTRGIFLVAPRIFEFLPRRSATNTVVTIFGENFESASSVRFNGVEAPFQIVGATQITALVPFGATNAHLRRVACWCGDDAESHGHWPGANYRPLLARRRCPEETVDRRRQFHPRHGGAIQWTPRPTFRFRGDAIRAPVPANATRVRSRGDCARAVSSTNVLT
jgi:hypothetical protein